MIDAPKPDASAPQAPQSHPSARSGLRRSVLSLAAVVSAGCVGAILYGMAAPGSKDAGAVAACQATQAMHAKLDALIHGEVAALSLPTQSRPVPDLTFAGPDGQKVRLSSFRGKPVLLNLWATWCIPCRQEMPALDRLQADATPDALSVVAINIDTARLDRPKAFLSEIGVKALPFYADSSADVFQVLKGAGKVVGLPTTILIGRDGCEIGTMAGPAQWDSPDAKALLSAAAG
jgi:thiol-disulfide isomerase/thioredoxin